MILLVRVLYIMCMQFSTGVRTALRNRRNKPHEYPSPEDMEKLFGMDVNFLAIKEPESMDELRFEIREREHRRAEARTRMFTVTSHHYLRDRFVALVDDLLQVMDSPSVRSFSNQRIRAIRQFNQTVADRSLERDEQLEKVAASVRAILRGITPRVVCFSDAARIELSKRIHAAIEPLRKEQ